MKAPEYSRHYDEYGTRMERSPSAFTMIDEEDLRQHFLVQLNGHYKGQATGETFNYQGKTDILVRAGGKNIFVAECKYWRGEKSYADTIDQIFRTSAGAIRRPPSSSLIAIRALPTFLRKSRRRQPLIGSASLDQKFKVKHV
jgi:hypothetical protein